MRSHLSFFVLVFFIVTIAACAPAIEGPVAEVDTTEADVEAINQVREQEVAALNAGDVEALLAVYTGDVAFMPPNDSLVVGREEVRTWAENMINEYGVEGAYVGIPEITVVGDWALERYSAEWTLTPKAGGEPMLDNIKGIHIYQRQPDGSWEIAHDIWNSNNPPPGQ